MKQFDVAIIGAGPGGYVAAIHAARNGMNVALVEKGSLGGACYNVGCIPSKIMLEHSKLVQTIQRGKDWGITVPTVEVDFPKLMKRKDLVIQQLLNNIQGFIDNAEITMFHGEAKVSASRIVHVGEDSFEAKHILLATGSRPFVPPFKGIETATYFTTDTFFDITQLPKQLTIIGGGVIAIEMAFSLAPLGTKVTILNHGLDILQTEEADARPIIKEKMVKLGIELIVDVTFNEFKGNEIYTSKGIYTYEHLLFATGRRPNIAIAESLGLAMEGRLIAVNEHYETSVSGIYAIGDLVGGFQLAHSASAEGKHVIDYLLGNNTPLVDQTTIPRCVYTHPEIATFGLLEQEVTTEEINITKINLKTNSKALMEGNTDGFIKLLTAKSNNQIIGACVVGDGATEILNSILAVKVAGGTANELACIVFPHPTVSEHIGDVASAAFGKGIHY